MNIYTPPVLVDTIVFEFMWEANRTLTLNHSLCRLLQELNSCLVAAVNVGISTFQKSQRPSEVQPLAVI